MNNTFYRFCEALVRPVLRIRFHYSWERIPDISGPFLLLSNHNTDLDPVFLAVTTSKKLVFVATEKILRMGFLSVIVMRFFHPIIHYKGKTGISSVKEILHQLKDGKNVALFPEGNRSFNGLTGSFVSATGKMAKRSGATLITYRLHGGYFTSPRWGKNLRRGQMRGEIGNIYPPEVLKSMSDSEINEAIRRDLYVDAYEDQQKQKIRYKGKERAVALESTLFLCPECRRFSVLKSRDDRIFCTACRYNAVYDEYGYIIEENGNSATITELDKQQRRFLQELLETEKKESLFSDNITEERIGTDHSILSRGERNLCAFSDRLQIGQMQLPFSEITGMAINQRNLLIIHYYGEDGHLELSGSISFNALKYLYLYQISGSKHEEI